MFKPSFLKLFSSSAISILDFINLFKLQMVTAGNLRPLGGSSCVITVFIGREMNLPMLMVTRYRKAEEEAQRNISQITLLSMGRLLSKM